MEYFNINFVWYSGKNFENDVIFQFNQFDSIIYEKVRNSYLFLIKDVEKLKEEINGRTIYSDCRLFSMLISCLNNNIHSFFMQLSIDNLSPEILVPSNVFYFTLDEKLIHYNSDIINLNMALGDMCGQWIIKENEETYVGFTKNGILKKTYKEWKDFYIENIKKKLNIENQVQHDVIMLRINICKNKGNIDVNLLSFDSIGNSITVTDEYTPEIEFPN